MARTLPFAFGDLRQFKAFQVIGFGTTLSITHNQVSALSTAETVIIAVHCGRLSLALLLFLLCAGLSVGRAFLTLSVICFVGPNTYKTRAVWLPANASGLLISTTVQIVIEGEFSAGGDVSDGEEADASGAVHHPLLGLAVRLTRVVHEPGQIAFRTRVDDRILVDGQEVKVGLIVVGRAFQSSLTLLFVNEFADIFDDELTFFYVFERFQTPPGVLCFEGFAQNVLTFFEPLVLTLLSCATQFGIAFDHKSSVDAVLVIAGQLIVLLAFAYTSLRFIRYTYLDFWSDRFV